MNAVRIISLASVFLLTACGGGDPAPTPVSPTSPSGISAVVNTTAQNLIVGTPMTSFTPLTASGGTTPYTYSVSGILPLGLSLNVSTGVVSGTPTAVYPSTNLVFSVKDATNVVASSTSTVNFTVSPVIGTTGNWTTSGSMTTMRTNHTATLLPTTGQVVVIGGRSSGNILSSAELYNPATGLFTATSSMVTVRARHTATLLLNGKVLVTGGYNSTGPLVILNSALLYDPATGVFTTTGNMVVERDGHTATLLSDGKVLITGGFNTNGTVVLNSAELYDPATGLFTTTGTMTTARALHASTRLDNGQVLITGGANLASTELYNPATGSFTSSGNMTTGRENHTATLLPGGDVLIVGGANHNSTPPTYVNFAEVYHPTTGLFSISGSMATVREVHTATLLTNGKVLIAGGYNNTSVISTAEIYDPLTSLFSSASNMTFGRVGHTATLLTSGKILVTGGTFLTNTELYQ